MANGDMVVSSLIDAQGCVVGYVDRFGRERDLAGNLLPGGYRPAPGAFLTNQRLWQSGAPVSVTGTTSETVLATIPIPAGAMGPNGALRVTALWSFTNGANAKSCVIRLGASQISLFSTTTTNSGQQQSVTRARGATNSQVTQGFGSTGFGTTTNSPVLTTVDMTSAQNVTLTGILTNASDTITLEAYTVELLNP
ncbi:hypothetical protein [Cupriavidus basilensis]|uniref:hypothetical protein n=1 Tax=Cupriavidus basilensis TaxID=68895 RepID=UPI0007518C09|nr:hypothetical protein [Cupriavidus basilensis]